MNWIERRKRRARRRRLIRGLGAGGLLLVSALLAGTALPAVRIRRGTLTLARSPEVVWWVLTDLDGMPAWRSDLRAVERLPDREGRLAWKEVGRSGSRVVELIEAEPLRRLVMGRTEGARTILRTIELAEPEGLSGTVVTVIEEERVGNPIARVLTRLPIPRDRTPRLLRDLADRFGDRPPVAVGRGAG
ncbi:MAG: SRPBCC family protein [Gemmatimonadales bacterium]